MTILIVASGACGGQSEQGPDGTAATGGAAGSPTDAGTGGAAGSGGLHWNASDGADAPVPCKCTASGYVISVTDGMETFSLEYPFVSPELGTYLQYCTPTVPALFTTHAVTLIANMTACAEAGEGRPCLQLNTKNSVPSYLDDGSGVLWSLSSVEITASGIQPPKVGGSITGTFSATATSSTATKSLSGTFTVCHAYALWKPI